jgi:heat shock protein HslJ
MKASILLFAAAALTAAAPPGAPASYGAGGSEPFWSLEIARGRITYDPATGDPTIRMPTPRPRAVRNGYRYTGPGLVIDVRHVRCEDEAERAHSDTVRVTAHGRTVEGCGGAVLPPEQLADTDWIITTIDRVAVEGDNYGLRFAGGRVNGQAGCNHFTGAYREARPLLRLGPIAVTRMACPDARMAHERRALRILAGPVRMTFVDGDTLVLTGNGGSIRLRP